MTDADRAQDAVQEACIAEHLARTVHTVRYGSFDPGPSFRPKWVVRD